jgi:hypothetical protein
MIHPLVKIITVDGFFTKEQAYQLTAATYNLQYVETEFGKEIPNFNLVPPEFNASASNILNTKIGVDENRSGFFRIPKTFIHFESFESTNEWILVVALQTSTFNVFEHKSGVSTALQGHAFNYRDLFQWDLKINYELAPGQGILFRPWLFHSFDTGLIQTFRVNEYENRI